MHSRYGEMRVQVRRLESEAIGSRLGDARQGISQTMTVIFMTKWQHVVAWTAFWREGAINSSRKPRHHPYLLLFLRYFRLSLRSFISLCCSSYALSWCDKPFIIRSLCKSWLEDWTDSLDLLELCEATADILAQWSHYGERPKRTMAKNESLSMERMARTKKKTLELQGRTLGGLSEEIGKPMRGHDCYREMMGTWILMTQQ